jgi:hypothetical protein
MVVVEMTASTLKAVPPLPPRIRGPRRFLHYAQIQNQLPRMKHLGLSFLGEVMTESVLGWLILSMQRQSFFLAIFFFPLLRHCRLARHLGSLLVVCDTRPLHQRHLREKRPTHG